MLAAGWRVLHHDKKHVFGMVDDNIDAGGAIPFDLPGRAGRRRRCKPGIGAHAEAVAKSKTVARIIVEIARDPRSRTDVIGGHGLEGCRPKNGLAVERAAI